MEVEVISEKIQKFNGVSYYLCGNYYQRKGVRLHRAVWELHNGNIPCGYDVHHKDENRNNNQIENLELLQRNEHHRYHSNKVDVKKRSRESIKKAIPYAADWHRSEEGRKWHSEHAKSMKITQKEASCAWCGCTFLAKYKRSGDMFCCNNHKASALRWRRKHEGEVNYPGRNC